MVGYSPRTEKLTHLDIIIAGGASGFITRCLCQPLDVLKIRFQLQVEPISKIVNAKYNSIPQAVVLICKEEGIGSLWKGHIPAQLLSIVYGLTQFWVFNELTKQSHELQIDTRYESLVNLSSGAMAGCSATFTSFPFDVVRTRLVAQSHQEKLYLNIFDAFKRIYKAEGAFVFYRGIFPTFLQVAPHAGVQFMCYKLFDKFYRSLLYVDKTQFSFSSSVVSGSLAGLVAKVSIYPLDLVKKRMQIQGMQENRKNFGKVFTCEGMIDCFRRIYHSEGILGFFKGLKPSILKAIFTTAIHFTSYEIVCKVLSDLHR